MEIKFKEYDIVENLTIGASSVKKYKLLKDGKYYLLRLFDIRFMDSRYEAFRNMTLLYEHNVPVPKIYDSGISKKDNFGYVILEWINGKSLDNILNNENSKYLGKLVSKELLKMHTIEVDTSVDIYEKFIASIKRKEQKLTDLHIENECLKYLRDYINQNKNILHYNNKNSIIHGDFHPGNIIRNPNGNIYFIDMDVCKINHPWFDLASISCNMEFPVFYSSVLLNYFDGEIPNDFWIIYNLFACWYCLDYILYSIRMNDKTMEDGIEKVEEFLDDNCKFQTLKPNWFLEKQLLKRR